VQPMPMMATRSQIPLLAMVTLSFPSAEIPLPAGSGNASCRHRARTGRAFQK
jgi:hypothetical protein